MIVSTILYILADDEFEEQLNDYDDNDDNDLAMVEIAIVSLGLLITKTYTDIRSKIREILII